MNAKIHINPKTGDVSACHAEKRCPFSTGDKNILHFSDEAIARSAFEKIYKHSTEYWSPVEVENNYGFESKTIQGDNFKLMKISEASPWVLSKGSEIIESLSKDDDEALVKASAYVLEDSPLKDSKKEKLSKSRSRERNEILESQALDIAYEMDLNSDWLTMVVDPETGEDVDSMEVFKRIDMAAGNCSTVAQDISEYTNEEFEYFDVSVDKPYLITHAANLYTDENREEWVVDFTYAQINPDAPWPYVARKSDWEKSVFDAGDNPDPRVKELIYPDEKEKEYA